jgi:hypothetical protein
VGRVSPVLASNSSHPQRAAFSIPAFPPFYCRNGWQLLQNIGSLLEESSLTGTLRVMRTIHRNTRGRRQRQSRTILIRSLIESHAMQGNSGTIHHGKSDRRGEAKKKAPCTSSRLVKKKAPSHGGQLLPPMNSFLHRTSRSNKYSDRFQDVTASCASSSLARIAPSVAIGGATLRKPHRSTTPSISLSISPRIFRREVVTSSSSGRPIFRRRRFARR